MSLNVPLIQLKNGLTFDCAILLVNVSRQDLITLIGGVVVVSVSGDSSMLYKPTIEGFLTFFKVPAGVLL